MKRKQIKSSLLSGVISLLLIAPGFRASGLKEIAKPHLGVYECTEARLSETDYLSAFEYIRLELKPQDEFVLYCKKKGGREYREEGEYQYDRRRGVIILSGVGNILKREFPLADGKIVMEIPFGNKNLFLGFEQK
jgi:hypothetical protein